MKCGGYGPEHAISLSNLRIISAFHFMSDAVGEQHINRDIARKVADDPCFDHIAMLKTEMVELYTKHAGFDFS